MTGRSQDLARRCRRAARHEDDRICICPSGPSEVRGLLSRPFIHGWIPARWYAEATRLAGDPASTQERLDMAFFELEGIANAWYGLWRNAR